MAADVAALGFEINSQPIKDMTVNMGAAEAAAKRLGISTDEMVKRIQAASAASNQHATATGATITATASAAKEMEKATAGATKLARETALVGRVLGAAAGEAQSFAGALGRVAPFLTALGPGGLAAAAGLGAVVIVIKKITDAAIELADRAGDLRDLSETVGFTTDQLQTLERAAGQVGVSQQQLSTGIERFSASLAGIKDRSGSAYEALLALNPVLAKQASNASTVAEAWDLVFKAMQKADQEQRNQAARAIFGRGGIALTRVGGATSDAGGVQALAEAQRASDRLTQDQIKHWDDLGDTIRENTRIGSQIIVSLFTGPVLEALKMASDKFLELAQSMQGVDWGKVVTGIGTVASALRVMIDPLGAAVALWGRFKSASGSAAGAPQGPNRFDMTFGDLSGADDAAARMKKIMKAADDAKQSIIQLAADSKRTMEALGSTATPAEKLSDQIKQLNAQVAQGKISADDAAVAQGRLGAAFKSTNIQATVAALGTAATVTEQYAAKIDALNEKVRTEGLSQETLRRGLQGLADDEQLRKLNDVVSIMGDAATASEKYEAKVKALDIAQKQGKITQDQYNKKIMEINPIMEAVTDAVAEVGSAMARAFIEGAKGAEALNRSLKSVASTAASGAITQLLKGNLENAAIAAAVAAGSFLASTFTKDDGSAAREAEIEAMNKAAEAAKAATETLRDMADATGDLQKKLKSVQDAFSEASINLTRVGQSTQEAAGLMRDALANITNDVIGEMQRTINEANGQGFISDFTDLFKKVGDTLDFMYKAGTATMENQQTVAQFQIVSAQNIINANKLAGEAYDNLLAIYPQLIGSVHEYTEALDDSAAVQKAAEEAARAAADAAEEAARKIAETAQLQLNAMEKSFDLQTRLNRAVQKNTGTGGTLDSLLANFDRDAQKQREDEVKAGGYNIVLLEQTLAEERLNVIKDYNDEQQRINDQIIADQKRVSDNIIEEQKRVFESIRDYLESLKFGSLSTLSKKDQLAAAQASFNTALATGDTKNITKLADNLLTVARDFYGPNAQYAKIYANTTGSLRSISGGMAEGGIVGNGMYGVDSVRAAYAGGGYIGLAGGEGIITADATHRMGGSAWVNGINGGGANDNTAAAIQRLESRLVQVLAYNAQLTQALIATTGEGVKATRNLGTEMRQGAGEKKIREAS